MKRHFIERRWTNNTWMRVTSDMTQAQAERLLAELEATEVGAVAAGWDAGEPVRIACKA